MLSTLEVSQEGPLAFHNGSEVILYGARETSYISQTAYSTTIYLGIITGIPNGPQLMVAKFKQRKEELELP